MIVVAMVVTTLSIAAAGGIAAPTQLDELKNLDAALADLLHDGPKLRAALATKAEVKKDLALTGVDAPTIEMIMAGVEKNQQTQPDTPKSFTPTIAVITQDDPKKSSSHIVSFYDTADSGRLDLDVMARDKKTVVLAEAPHFNDKNPWSFDRDRLHADGTLTKKNVAYFEKKDGAWVSAPFPPANPQVCVDRLHTQAKRIVDAELAAKKAKGTFIKMGGLSLDMDNFGVYSDVKSADANHFVAELSVWGGKITVDETGKIVDVSPCKMDP